MNWDAVGAISEAIGVVAILISLIYVAAQIRQNTHQNARSIKATQLAAFESNIESGNRIRELLLLHPDLARLLMQGYESYDKLSAIDALRFSMLLRNMFSYMQAAYVRQLSLDYDPDEFSGATRVLDEILDKPGVQEWLKSNEPDWRLEFRNLVNERLDLILQKQMNSADSD